MPNPLNALFSKAFDAMGERISQVSEITSDVADRWREGDLSYKLAWKVQQKMAALLESPGSLKKILNCSRRLRKSTTALIKSIEIGRKRKRAQIRFAAPTQKMLRKIVHPLVGLITNDAPTALKPIWKSQDGLYFFPGTESELHIAGVNNGHEDDLRGTAADLCVVDEAQLITNLRYVVDDVLMPQLITTEGPLWMLLTPPKTPVHECVGYVMEAQAMGANSYAEYDIHQSEYTQDVVDRFCKEAGGKESTTWMREYLCKFVVDKNFAVVPEWSDLFVKEYVPDEYFKFYLKYAGMDIGVRDLTVIIFGVYDFKQAKLFIQDEIVFTGPEMTTEKVAQGIKSKEKDLWKELKPTLRISDNNNLILLQDLGLLHAIHFAPTTKDTLEAMVNNLRLWVSSGRIQVSPKCTQTIGSLKYGVWDDKRKQFERSVAYGHFDALAALIYLVRYVDTATNPIPPDYGIDKDKMFVPPGTFDQTNGNAQMMLKALLGKKK